jgi:hypothetical protein
VANGKSRRSGPSRLSGPPRKTLYEAELRRQRRSWLLAPDLSLRFCSMVERIISQDEWYELPYRYFAHIRLANGQI